jgi:hypothetical protein
MQKGYKNSMESQCFNLYEAMFNLYKDFYEAFGSKKIAKYKKDVEIYGIYCPRIYWTGSELTWK